MSFKTNILALICALAAATANPTWAAREPSIAEIKAESLRYLQDLRVQNNKRLLEIQNSIEKEGESDEKSQIDLKAAQKEHTLRQNFLDRFILQVDTKFRGGDFRAFVEHALQEIKRIEEASPSENGDMSQFLNHAADTLHRLPEKKENVLSFLEDFISHSILKPVTPEEYLSSRNYSNGSVSESGKPLDRTEAGALAERRLRQLTDGSFVIQKRRR